MDKPRKYLCNTTPRSGPTTAESTHSSESSDHSDPPAQMGLLTSTGRLIWRYRTSRPSFPHAYHWIAHSTCCRKYLRRKQDNDQFLFLNIVGFQATYIDLGNQGIPCLCLAIFSELAANHLPPKSLWPGHRSFLDGYLLGKKCWQ